MQFTENYDAQEYPRTKWTTKFFIKDDEINGIRILESKLWKLTVKFTSADSFKSVLEKVDRITSIDDEMFVMLAEAIKRDKLDDY